MRLFLFVLACSFVWFSFGVVFGVYFSVLGAVIFGFFVWFFVCFGVVFSPLPIRRNDYQQRGVEKERAGAEKRAQKPMSKGIERKNANC